MIAVVGAGPTGLSLAWALKRRGVECALYEASGQVGGNVRTVEVEGCRLELGPNSLRMDDALYELICELGLEKALVYAAPAARHRYVLKDGRYARLPGGPVDLLLGNFFPWRAKLRFWRERKVPVGRVGLETVDGFVRRRFGDYVADYVLGPFVGGIFAGDARKLVAEVAFPDLVRYEKEYGSVIRGMLKGRKRNRHKGIFSFRRGLGTLMGAMGDALGEDLHLNRRLVRLHRMGGKWQLVFEDGVVEADKVVLAMPAHAIAGVMGEHDGVLGGRLRGIYYPPVTVVHHVYRAEDVGFELNGFGALHGPGSEAGSMGVLFSSTVFPQQVGVGKVLLTTMVGGAVHPERALLGEGELLALVEGDHGRYLGVKGRPELVHVTRYGAAIPQYDLGVVGLGPYLEGWEAMGLYLVGNWRGGISVPNCMQQGLRLCEQLTGAVV